MAQVAQGGCRFSVLGDAQKMFEHGPEQPALVDPALSKGVD